MPINALPERDPISYDAMSRALATTAAWKEFFRSVFYGLFGWKRSYTATKNFDFPNIVAGGESTTTVAVPGARAGDAVLVSPKTKVAGLGADGYVSANDVVTIRRFNYSTGAVDPAADDFRVIVWQQ